jgi:hypothetical protein
MIGNIEMGRVQHIKTKPGANKAPGMGVIFNGD